VGITAGLAESNGSLPAGLTHITCRLTAKNRDQLRNPMLGNRVWATFFTLSWAENEYWTHGNGNAQQLR